MRKSMQMVGPKLPKTTSMEDKETEKKITSTADLRKAYRALTKKKKKGEKVILESESEDSED